MFAARPWLRASCAAASLSWAWPTGVYAEAGYGASANAIITLTGRGIDLREHRSQPVTMRLLAEADIVLVMEEAHRRSLFYLAPQHLAKVFLLTEMAGGYEDVADPYGGPLEGYAFTADLLARLIEAGLPKILRRIGVTLPAGAAAGTSAA